MTEAYGYFSNIAFNMLLAILTPHFDDSTLKALALKAGYATHEAKFESIMQIIKNVEINALRSVDPTLYAIHISNE